VTMQTRNISKNPVWRWSRHIPSRRYQTNAGAGAATLGWKRSATQWKPFATSTKAAGYDTNHDTNVMVVSTRPSNLLRDLVDLVGIEPTTSSMPWKD
jgi:hypothetical protein